MYYKHRLKKYIGAIKLIVIKDGLMDNKQTPRRKGEEIDKWGDEQSNW